MRINLLSAVVFFYTIIVAIITNFFSCSLLLLSLIAILGTSLFLFFCLVKHQKKVITAFNVFYLCICLFSFGQLILLLIGIKETPLADYSLVYRQFEQDTLIKGVIFSINCVDIIASAGMLFIRKQTQYVLEERKEFEIKITSIGFFVICIILILALVGDINRAINVSVLGYRKGFTIYASNSIIASVLYYASIFRRIIIIVLLYCYRNKPQKRRIYIYIALYIILQLLFIKNRGGAVIDLASYVMFQFSISPHNQLQNKRNKRIIFFLVVVGIIVLPYISSTRISNIGLGITNYLKAFNSMEIVLMEFGGSLETLLYTIEHTISHAWGYQLLVSASNLLPGSEILFGNLSDEYQFLSKLGLGNLGLGTTLLSEAYYNFGNTILSYIFIFIIAIIVVNVTNKLSSNNSYSPKIVIFQGILYSVLLTLIRSSMVDLFSTIKIWVYFLLICKLTGPYLYSVYMINSENPKKAK